MNRDEQIEIELGAAIDTTRVDTNIVNAVERRKIHIYAVHGLESELNSLPRNFVELHDTPANYDAGKYIRVNQDGDGLEYSSAAGIVVSWGDIVGVIDNQTDLVDRIDNDIDEAIVIGTYNNRRNR